MDAVRHLTFEDDTKTKKESPKEEFSAQKLKFSPYKTDENELFFIQEYKSQQIYIEELRARNKEMKEASLIIEQKNNDILESLTYARRIQGAILPDDITISKILNKHLLMYMPKDIVSGDFYWISKVGDNVIIVSGDCTGHGVPGAFMTFVGCMLLNSIVNEQLFSLPSYILYLLHKEVRQFFSQHKSESELNDGMELAICSINFETRELKFAGANRPLVITHHDKLNVIKGDPYGVGGLVQSDHREFTNHTISLEPGSSVYLYTDGFTDQFGGDRGKKFSTKRLYQLLSNISRNSISEKKSIIENTFKNWKGEEAQVDDVLLLCIDI